MTTSILAWELLGAVVGAGMASGREIASFFSRYGAWSWAAIAIAVGTMYILSRAKIPSAWQERWPGRLWRAASALLLTATGGAMLAGAGEIARLTLPVYGAYWIGAAVTALLAWLLAHRMSTGLAWVSRCMLCVLMILIALGLTAPPMRAAYMSQPVFVQPMLRGFTYGGFNAALQAPVMAASAITGRMKRRSAACACLILTGLMLIANAVLLRHPALLGEEMPFVQLMNRYGRVGYLLGAGVLYLAVLSTTAACLRGLGKRPVCIPGMLLTAMAGFSGVVDLVYPVLGGLCAAILLAAKIQEFFRNHFYFPR